MSVAAFQSAMMRLVTDPDFRDDVRAHGAAACARLTPREAARLDRIAVDPGVDINRTLHKGFRFGKLRSLLPLTCHRLGPQRLAREVARFWQDHPPAGFSFLPEALDFCDVLASRGLRLRHLDEVLAYERAVLELQAALPGEPLERRVPFSHDPRAVLSALSRQQPLRGIAAMRCVLAGRRRAAGGGIEWAVERGAPADAPSRRARPSSGPRSAPRPARRAKPTPKREADPRDRASAPPCQA